MKNLRKMENFAADDGSNPSLFKGASLADNSSSSNETPKEDYNGPYNFNVQFNPFVAIIILVLLSIFFFIGFFCIFVRRRRTRWDDMRTFRRAAATAGAGANINREGLNRETTRGLDRTVIESFPVFSYNLVKGLKARTKGSECAVCLSDFEEEEMLRLLPVCSHAFHPECIDTWLCTHTTCPVCRTSLLPADDSNPTDTDFGVVEPQAAPSEQVAIVIDSGGGVSRHGSVRGDVTNDEATDGALGCDSMGHSLVRVRKESEQPTEWYISTPAGLKPGLHRNCSFVAKRPSQEPSSSGAPPACSKPGGSVSDAARGSKSERWGSIPMNPASFVRTFSERATGDQAGVEQQDRKAYLKRTLSWLLRRDGSERSQSGSVSSTHATASHSDYNSAA